MKTVLPSFLTVRAFTASNREIAWRREDLAQVVGAYEELGYAVEAFEVWVVNDKGQWNGFFPIKDGTEAICVYDVEPQHGESNLDFASRCAKEILDKVQEMDIESEVDPKCLPWLRYNLYVNEEYKNPNKAVDSTATRVTPPASSLRSGQESRHGQP